jgi:hypothetical protein
LWTTTGRIRPRTWRWPARTLVSTYTSRQPALPGNLIERWFAALTEKQIKRGAHRSTREIEVAIREYLTITNETVKPFVLTKTADQILASVARF